MKVTKALGGFFSKLFSGFFGAGLVFVLYPILLLLTGSAPEGGSYTDVELGFSLLALAETSGCVAGLIYNAYRLVEEPLRIDLPLVRLPEQPEPSLRQGQHDKREQALPVVASSLVLPTLISGLGGWVESFVLAPRTEARLSAA